MLCVIEYFAKSLKFTQDHSKWHCWVGRMQVPISILLKLCLYLIPLLKYSASKNVVTLKPGVGVVQDHTVFRTVFFRVGVTKCSPFRHGFKKAATLCTAAIHILAGNAAGPFIFSSWSRPTENSVSLWTQLDNNTNTTLWAFVWKPQTKSTQYSVRVT